MLWMLWKSGQFNFDDELEAGAHLPRCGGLRRGVAVHLNPGMESLTEHQQSLRVCNGYARYDGVYLHYGTAKAHRYASAY